ncbi:fatty acyl-AMP ligase [Richelia sinica]|uniref:fatty acyl-AMP ligase n=1 Tax=Richelia sinica TaxID=1357545 RepID=UPI0018EFAF39|nr:fatty acyl-AMP ligase [Richelia sinica]
MRARAQQQPHDRAFIFLKDGEVESGSLTYDNLDEQARAIAATLQSVTSVGERVLLVYPFNACLEFIAAIFGCFYAGVIAIPIQVPHNPEEWADLSFRVQECQVNISLTVAVMKAQLENSWLDSAPANKDLSWIATDTILLAHAAHWQKPNIEPHTIAYFQYTSGSTGIPKAVVITHGNVLQNCANFQKTFAHLNFRAVGWLPLTHDFGLVAGVMQTIYTGGFAAFMSPIAVFQNPSRWLKAISTYKAIFSGAPNFAYDVCVQRINPAEIPNLDLSNWQIAGNGAEPIRPETLERFTEVFAPYGFCKAAFYLSYGMAEATLVISGGAVNESSTVKFVDEQALQQNRVVMVTQGQPGARTVVNCGCPWPGNRVVIVNLHTLTPCLPDAVGEIWVQGAGLSSSYWHQPEETEKTFQAYLKDSQDGPFLRTGDLGFLHDGQLFITGRLKDIMIFWGRNFYPQILEQTCEKSHPALSANGSAAFAIDVEGEERLVIVQEVNRHALRKLNGEQVAEIIGAIRQAMIMQHLVEVYAIALIKPSTLPKTTSGKVQRRHCRDLFLAGKLALVENWYCPDSERLDPAELTALPGMDDT